MTPLRMLSIICNHKNVVNDYKCYKIQRYQQDWHDQPFEQDRNKLSTVNQLKDHLTLCCCRRRFDTLVEFNKKLIRSNRKKESIESAACETGYHRLSSHLPK